MRNGTFVFDSSAVVRYLDRKAGFERVRQILKDHAAGKAEISISAVQWGEIAKIIGRRYGTQAASEVLSRLTDLGFEAAPVTAQDAVGAAIFQNALNLSYADAFVVVLAQQHEQSVVVTADFDFKVAAHIVPIEFLPPNVT